MCGQAVKIQNNTSSVIKTKVTIDCDMNDIAFRIIWTRFSQIFEFCIVLKMKLFSRCIIFVALSTHFCSIKAGFNFWNNIRYLGART